MMQSLLPALYPMLRSSYQLSFTQIGLLTFTFQFTASLLQPLVGAFADKSPRPYSLAAGMGFTLVGLVLLAFADSYALLLFAAALIGTGSSVFHPESSRVARMASGGQHGMAQSLFQVGGNAGSAMGPLLAAFILPRKKIFWSLAILVALMFSKYFYLASLGSYYTFYLMDKFHVSVRSSEIHLFAFLGAVAAGTFFGGPVGDRMGRKVVIWYSILGVLPFTLLLPYANLFWTGILSVVIGLILASAFSTILVFAQELVPGKVGTVSGFFFGLAFGLGGIGAALLGKLADITSIGFVYHVCSFLPAVGILTVFLPDLEPASKGQASR